MIADLKRYSATKDSGVPWLGDVPEHWEVQRAKTLFRTVDIRSESGAEELLTVSSNLGVIPRRSANVTMFKAESYAGHKLCWPGDLVINSLWAWSRGLGVSQHHGIVSTAYGVYRAHDTSAIDPRFVHEFVRSTPFHWELRVRSKGVWTSRLQLTDESFLDAPIPLSPLPEQSAIVRFLDHADRRIRRYIRARQTLIKLLEEQKQAIVHRAVTRGLDPNVRLKPSGVEWLGDVPAHWEVVRAKYFYREVDERSKTGAEELLSVSHITGVTPRSQKDITMFMAESYVGHKICRPGDLVINTMWAWMAALGVSQQVGIVSPAYGVYRPLSSSRLLGEFADLLLGTRPYVSEYICRSTGIRASRLRLYPEQFLRVRLACPPPQEQREILSNIGEESSSADGAIAIAKHEISLLREYRTRLIADVVTGKLDVRDAAGRLPDQADEPEPFDEADDLSDADEATADDFDEVPEEATA